MFHLYVELVVIFLYGEQTEAGLRIFQGRDVVFGEFPYVAIWGDLKKQGKGKVFETGCTCSIISPTWTLTAAHCMDKPPSTNNGYICYGSHLPLQLGNLSKVLEAIPHPIYNFDDASGLFSFDIGLLRTKRIQISQYGVLSGVDYRTLIGQEIFVVGYGATNYSNEVATSFYLKRPPQVYKGIVNRCLESENNYSICVAPPCGSLAMVCGGDSGGPMVHASGIIGVNSWGWIGCESVQDLEYMHKHILVHASSAGGVPVSPMLDWISRRTASVT